LGLLRSTLKEEGSSAPGIHVRVTKLESFKIPGFSSTSAFVREAKIATTRVDAMTEENMSAGLLGRGGRRIDWK